ncbi:ABC transporter substrate-binding protein [Streptomyces tubbatahanensis]|uniref:ABC transporter substrate-binding protein n=1 Tax=Streptomyces tubbatahanensis TaxID=2923272 RepID=A0ABY3XNS9_9ACTN|nr:ABC transporter substrate-binding protein [Streptomyces tubbatahanensis]UNS96076.1 ABC transporter substrate-binding protein [Streptomyces tubbatahanensis]
MNRKTVVLPVLVGLLAPALAACGSEEGGSADGEPIVVGTTDHFAVSKDAPAPFDPAAAYDVAAWSVMRNTFQTLLRLPRTGTSPEMDAASKCGFTDAQNEQYRCTVRKGLTFSGGNELDAKDVAFSLQRLQRINHKGGPAVLFSNLDRVEARGKREVVFHLKNPDATFPYKLTTPAAAIVDSQTYPADSLVRGSELTGSGPYALDRINAKSAVLTKNPHYNGDLEMHNSKIELRFFDTSRSMEKALKADKIDVMGRTISPDRVNQLEGAQNKGIELVEQPGQEIRYLAFDTDDDTAGKKAVRQAMAQLVDRKEITREAYDRSAEALYSLVPAGLTAHRNSFFSKYGEPSKEKAERILSGAGIHKPVELTLTYTTDHYGDATAKEFAALKKQLNDSGLFKVETKGVEWSTFRPAATSGKYQVWGYGWYPDFPDADNFIAPFFEKDNFLGSPYTNRKIRDKIVPQTRRQTERTSTTEAFGRAQDIVAEDVPVLPLWQGKQYLAAGDDITGVEWALSSSSVLQLWELGRGEEG